MGGELLELLQDPSDLLLSTARWQLLQRGSPRGTAFAAPVPAGAGLQRYGLAPLAEMAPVPGNKAAGFGGKLMCLGGGSYKVVQLLSCTQ